MSEGPDKGGGKPGRGRSDLRVKLGFLAVAIVLGAGVFWLQLRPPPGVWSTDLPAALRQAKAEDRRLLVFFTSSPPGETARRIDGTTLRKPHNLKAIADGKFLCVRASLDTALESETARRFRIARLPTMLLLSPEGVELNRREGMIGEVPFRQGFLDCTQIVKPEAAKDPHINVREQQP